MGDRRKVQIIQDVCKHLTASQELIEKSAFEAINHQDKTSAMVTMSMTYVMELLSSLELIGMELEATAMNLGDSCNLPIQKLNQVLSKQNDIVAEIGSIYQQMLSEQEGLSTALHIMESEIASHRDSIEMSEELLLDNMEAHSVE
ncbi:hypothetical protein [Clostridium sp. Marseille-P299]|uniref:hypothetical protein n=1 Tax=Clostridium sp. Marseille-P299 TaxID=1805477 RepID=UPI0008349AF2|nr:hypothetical protein [Clostridium sp. Marseille-P299]